MNTAHKQKNGTVVIKCDENTALMIAHLLGGVHVVIEKSYGAGDSGPLQSTLVEIVGDNRYNSTDFIRLSQYKA
jgi:hypothetical protein